jgi:hypothetical protein
MPGTPRRVPGISIFPGSPRAVIVVKKPPTGQLGFDLEGEEAPVRKRRPRGAARKRAAAKTRPREAQERPLLTAPVVRRCGLCGAKLTILGQAAKCPHCGGIVGRQMEPDAG